MAVYYRFKHSTVKESIPIDDVFITVRDLAQKIIEAKKLTRGNFGLVITDPLTNEDYVDEGTLIRRCSTVLIRRVPRRPPMPIVIGQPGESCESGDVQTVNSGFVEVGSSGSGKDKPKPAIFGGDTSGRMVGTPPQGYVCYRCRVPGHFIQHCPTNGDPNYDIKRVKPPIGIPKSMLLTSSDGSYVLPSGAVAVLQPNEAAFAKEIEGLPSASSSVYFPPELHCSLCKQVMKDAVFTSKCCFESFCDKCIREHVITKSMCVCGATDILADYLIPNKTLRDTISHMFESDYGSGKSSGGTSKSQDMDSCRPQPRAPSSTHSMASKGEEVPPPAQKEETTKEHEVLQKGEAFSAPQLTMENMRLAKVADACVSEATHKSLSAPLTDKVWQKPASGEASVKKGKKRERKKANLDLADAEMQWRAEQDVAAKNYLMSMGPGHAAYDTYWTGMNACIVPNAGAVPYMGFGLGPFGGVLPQPPFRGQGCMMRFGTPQRDIANTGMESNARPPLPSKEDLKVTKANVKSNCEVERFGEGMGLPKKDQEYGREANSTGGISSSGLKSKAVPPVSSSKHHHHHRQRSWNSELPHPSLKRKSDHNADHNQHHDHHNEYYRDTEHHYRDHKDDRHHRISKQNLPPSSEERNGGSGTHRDFSNGHYEHKTTSIGTRKNAANSQYESSGDYRHLKRRRSSYSNGLSREREREQTSLVAC